MFFKLGVLINFPILTRKFLRWSPFLIQLEAWRPATLIKKRSQRKCFPRLSQKFYQQLFYGAPRWLPLKMGEWFIRIFNSNYICTEEFMKEKDLNRLSLIGDMKWRSWNYCKHSFLCKQWYLAGLTWRKPFSHQKGKLYTLRIITCDVKIRGVLYPRNEKPLPLRKAIGTTSPCKQRESQPENKIL